MLMFSNYKINDIACTSLYCTFEVCHHVFTSAFKLFYLYKKIFFNLNSIYFQISIYTWQHTSIQIHGKWIGKQVTKTLYKFFSSCLDTLVDLVEVTSYSKGTEHAAFEMVRLTSLQTSRMYCRLFYITSNYSDIDTTYNSILSVFAVLIVILTHMFISLTSRRL